MSDTPRTDKAAWVIPGKRIGDFEFIDDTEVVSAVFARQLERELSEARSRIDVLEDDIFIALKEAGE